MEKLTSSPLNKEEQENTMNHYLKFRFKLLVILILLSFSVNAHHPEIVADALCDETTGQYVILYTSTPWSDCSFSSCENSRIEILINNVLVETNEYSEPDYTFSGQHPAPTGSQPGDAIVVTAHAVDNWGNGRMGGQSSSATVIMPDEVCESAGTGRFTGGGHQLRVDGVRITRGLTIHCDLLLSNNLEINWQGNQFHMLEHMETVACTDDPDIHQAPPDAPLDTLVGVGLGRYNNQEGFTIEFTLVDGGEPGREDMAALNVYETADPGNIILDIPLQYMTGGNLQAHYDQPHKN